MAAEPGGAGQSGGVRKDKKAEVVMLGCSVRIKKCL